MSKPTNRAAFLSKAKANPLSVESCPQPVPKPHQLLIRVHALALNPIDHILQTHGTSMAFPHLKYPLVLGFDVAGTVISVGSSVTDFSVGDRVLGFCLGTDKEHNETQNAEAGFQEYAILQPNVTSKVPENVSFEQACVLPLALATAICGLYGEDYLGLEFPEPGSLVSRKKVVLIWGGSTSVGTCAIQLAVASGYEVVTTCSPKNNEYCRSLGAKQCFDYRSPTIRQDVAAALMGQVCAGAMAIGTTSTLPCIDIMGSLNLKSHSKIENESSKNFVCVVSGPEFASPEESFALLRTLSRVIVLGVSLLYKTWRYSVGWKFVVATEPARNEIGPAVFNAFLPKALETGQFRALPQAQVVGQGLEKVQEAIDLLKKGVSASKVVVTLV
jgi:NADPH:quinone reductase-like Zn-dependent oxidoreductase